MCAAAMNTRELTQTKIASWLAKPFTLSFSYLFLLCQLLTSILRFNYWYIFKSLFSVFQTVNKNFIHQTYKYSQCMKTTNFLKVQASVCPSFSFYYSLNILIICNQNTAFLISQYFIYMNKGKWDPCFTSGCLCQIK